ncbi:hypothetical protein FIBSPDRAFT_851372 [Athelia psychrophila]|uniref:Uncharacterized protein n=1 Tax=Athelia psychrophila TaxID=1759441 RepID=A0A167XCM7_9AGAM|nr:hypothetical protein FIBSPDRAFT_875929 [Fibularhizoctonia sp. CBS 109695]KZP29766.1 hypothetical protein FIBSPDRAFT_851372 [Fibularhizoctonia sp. CBS 109695]
MAATAKVCPIVGTTNTVLPPTHPEFDLHKAGQTCPVTNATTDHHSSLSKHPYTSIDTTPGAQACPALKSTINSPQNQKLDEGICPIVGPVSTILPPDHPEIKEGKEECPVTKAKVEHHEGKVLKHPSVAGAPEGAVCPVAGVSK